MNNRDFDYVNEGDYKYDDDINKTPIQIKQKINLIDEFDLEKKLYINEGHTELIYPRTSKMAYIIEEYTDYICIENKSTSFEPPYKLDELAKHGVKSDKYTGNELLWGKNANTIYNIRFINEFVKLAKSVNDETIKICESDDTPIMLESENLRMLIAHRKWGNEV